MKLAEVSIRRPVLATVMIGALVVFGITAYPKIGVDLFPDIEFPFASVRAIYPGADPETIESKVVDKLEEAINTVNGIEMLRSTSMENVGLVLVQFELERDAEKAVQDIRDKVASALPNLPPDLEPPVVEKFDVGAAPIMVIVISGSLPTRELTALAEDVVKQRLQVIQGVGGIDVVGGQEREFHVWLSPPQLESYGLTTAEVLGALAAQNVDIPGGRLDLGARELSIKTHGQVASREALENIIIMAPGGRAIRIKDVARVEDGEEERRSASALDGQSAIALVVRKQAGGNTVEVAASVREALDEVRAQLPAGVTAAVPIDNSSFIEHSIHDVQFDLAFGALLAVFIILLFLHDWRATFISALTLPASVIATVAFLGAMDFTFNNMTMLALSLSIGILIDDAIVVIENIHRHREMGKSAKRAAADGTREIGLAVMATTACIVAVFLPVAIMRGIIGRFFMQFGLTVAFAVSVSLFVAFTLTPMLSARMLAKGHGKNPLSRAIEAVLGGIEAGYRRLLAMALRQRLITLLIGLAAFMSTGWIMQFVPMEFMPPDERGQFNVQLELSPGTSLAATEALATEVAEDLRDTPGIASTFYEIGGGGLEEVHKATITVSLVPRAERAFDQVQAMTYVRELLARYDQAKTAVEPVPLIGGSSGMRASTIQYNLRGSDYVQLSRDAEALVAALRERGGYVDLDTTYRGGKPEVAVIIDRDRAADQGVPVAVIASTVRTYFAGAKATELATDGDRFDVRVRLDASHRRDPAGILDLDVRTPVGALVPLKNFVTLDPGEGPAQIERESRQRQVTILANLEGKALGEAVAEIDALSAEVLPADTLRAWTGMGDVMMDSMAALIEALLLAIVLIYLILAAQFESFVHPLTIMFSLPLSVVGALGALALGGMTISIFSMIGVIMLMGLVTKNAILLVDYTNTLRDRGEPRGRALLEAGAVRLRPILMTTAAMIFGMLPVAMALSEGGEQRAPMAVTVIGGLISSTLLTLVVVPVVYDLLDAAGERVFGARRSRTAGLDEEPAGA